MQLKKISEINAENAWNRKILCNDLHEKKIVARECCLCAFTMKRNTLH
jgi:hypothetical protein